MAETPTPSGPSLALISSARFNNASASEPFRLPHTKKRYQPPFGNPHIIAPPPRLASWISSARRNNGSASPCVPADGLAMRTVVAPMQVDDASPTLCELI